MLEESVEAPTVVNGHPASMPSSPLPPFNILPPTDDDDSDDTVPRPASPKRNSAGRPLSLPLPTPPATAELAAVASGGVPALDAAAAPLAPPGLESGLGHVEAEGRAKRPGVAEAAERKAKKARVEGKAGKERDKERRAKAVKRRSLGAGFR